MISQTHRLNFIFHKCTSSSFTQLRKCTNKPLAQIVNCAIMQAMCFFSFALMVHSHICASRPLAQLCKWTENCFKKPRRVVSCRARQGIKWAGRRGGYGPSEGGEWTTSPPPLQKKKLCAEIFLAQSRVFAHFFI